jgi:hypothetical protein
LVEIALYAVKFSKGTLVDTDFTDFVVVGLCSFWCARAQATIYLVQEVTMVALAVTMEALAVMMSLEVAMILVPAATTVCMNTFDPIRFCSLSVSFWMS